MSDHGTNARYVTAGCRCERCTVAHRRYCKAWRRRAGVVNGDKPTPRPVRVPIDGVRDHLMALLASGWTWTAISREASISFSVIGRVFGRRAECVIPATASRILALEPLEPVTVDDVNIERLADGILDWTRATKDERIAAAALMDHRRVPRVEIESRTHLRLDVLATVWARDEEAS